MCVGKQVQGLSLKTAMALYGLTHSELFWEKALDTKLLMAWNAHTIVVAFRGTASLSNALADLQACTAAPSHRRAAVFLLMCAGTACFSPTYLTHAQASRLGCAQCSSCSCRRCSTNGYSSSGAGLSK